MALLNEPSAAGFEYTHRYRNTVTSRRDHVVVYDIGGGTFDVSLVRMSGSLHEVVATTGINRLGGDDFDDQLVALALKKLGLAADSLPAGRLARLTDHCRYQKERLNPSSRRITLDLAQTLGIEHPSRNDRRCRRFHAACAPLINRTIDSMRWVMGWIDSTGEGNGVSAAPRKSRSGPMSPAFTSWAARVRCPASVESCARRSAKRCTARRTLPRRRPSVSPSPQTRPPGFN